ncbi:MAG: hypothetical protein LBJ67_07780 [Planctomycetaceae bacterium]|jgi:hypothetical protein|nr:hypothetical protein [Planctomycetaceae bacterium]
MLNIEAYVMRQSKCQFDRIDNLLSCLDFFLSGSYFFGKNKHPDIDFWRGEIESMKSEIESELFRIESILE